MTIDQLYEALKSIPEADALALAGSRASGYDDEKSDYDLYVYSDTPISEEKRSEILLPLCERAEIGNVYFESEDNIVVKGGIKADIIYRRLSDIEKVLDYTLERHMARNGYTTCFWHNVRTSMIVFDKSGRYTKLREKAQCSYPKELKEAIIKLNMALLTGFLPSYDDQIKKAYSRRDYVSVNHRVSAFLESYFDVIFAVNEMTHPGEKRLVQICEKECKILPENFSENLTKLFENMFRGDVSDIIESIVKETEKIV